MKIGFANNSVRRDLSDDSGRVKKYGVACAQKLKFRLEALWAAESLADFVLGTPPERLHELQGKQAGVFSMDAKHPFRLLFKPVDGTQPRPENIKAFLKSVTAIEVIGVIDTHG